jgi:hypothetical protein
LANLALFHKGFLPTADLDHVLDLPVTDHVAKRQKLHVTLLQPQKYKSVEALREKFKSESKAEVLATQKFKRNARR